MFRGMATALVGTIVVLAMLGTALGASLGETDLLNPNTSASQARRTDAQTQAQIDQARLETERRSAEVAAQEAEEALNLKHQAALYAQEEKRSALELEHYEAALAEERAARQRQYELQLQQAQRILEQEMVLAEMRESVLLGIGSGAITALTIAAAYYLYACGRARLLQVTQSGAGHQVPAGLAAAKPVTGTGWQATPAYQGQSGGNGRGPRVYSRSQR